MDIHGSLEAQQHDKGGLGACHSKLETCAIGVGQSEFLCQRHRSFLSLYMCLLSQLSLEINGTCNATPIPVLFVCSLVGLSI